MTFPDNTAAKHAAQYIIGIDPGVKTGIAIMKYPSKEFVSIRTSGIISAMKEIKLLFRLTNGKVFVRVEDARLRKWFGSSGPEKWQGAGSIKRDCKIWEEFLVEHKIPHEFVPPMVGGTKTTMTDGRFRLLTKYRGTTSEHGRDAAMLAMMA